MREKHQGAFILISKILSKEKGAEERRSSQRR